jgi:hypothetical protein
MHSALIFWRPWPSAQCLLINLPLGVPRTFAAQTADLDSKRTIGQADRRSTPARTVALMDRCVFCAAVRRIRIQFEFFYE